MPWAASVPAVLLAWYPGVEGGSALADVVTGSAEPGGRLPFVMPTSPEHLPHFDRDAECATYDLLHGQWKLDADGVTAHFPFGHGLGYTSFSIEGTCPPGACPRGDRLVEVEVANTGDRDGSTVVFAFAGLDGSVVERPRRRLVGFRRVDVPARTTTRTTIDLDWSALDVRRDGRWWTEPGRYDVDIGFHANDPAAVTVHVDRA